LKPPPPSRGVIAEVTTAPASVGGLMLDDLEAINLGDETPLPPPLLAGGKQTYVCTHKIRYKRYKSA
jgi:hypothetical protein